MNDVETPAFGEQSDVDRLLEASWEVRDRRASRRESFVEVAAGGLFALAAAALFVLSGAVGHFDVATAALMVALYTAVARVEFPIGAGHVVPTQLMLIPLLVVMPAGSVPALAAGGLFIGAVIDWRAGRIAPRRVLSAVPDAWHAVGPALVLVLAGSPSLGHDQIGLLAAVFVASCVVDLGAALARAAAARHGIELGVTLHVIVMVWIVDACLAPVGFLIGVAARENTAAALFVLPLAALLWLLARDRNDRIAQAHGRLKLVQHERARLQSAVRRLGDAFAAKLEVGALLEILMRGSIEALDAAAGQLQLFDSPSVQLLEEGDADSLRTIVGVVRRHARSREARVHAARDETWVAVVPITIAAEPHIAGELRLVRDARPFEQDEMALLAELVAKAELAAAEILANQMLRDQAVTDPLTGLGNRRRLREDLGARLERAAEGSSSLLLLFDLDGFKRYNDTFGHLAGDALLTRLAAKLADAVAAHGDAYRLGGDEFCALVDLEGADLDDIVARAGAALSETGDEFSIGASLGVVVLPHEADSPDHALQLADERMYANKRSQRPGPRDQARDVLMRTMQIKQPELDDHGSKVAELAARVARHLGLAGEQLDEVVRAAELHDIGKVGIPDEILNKPGGLNAHEWEFMHQHTILGERILNAAPALRPVARLVRSSHEAWDGTGYPDGLRGEEIPLGARIVAVCDAYDAMTADRPYRAALDHDEACRELLAKAGTQFDARIVDVFLTVVDASDRIARCEEDSAVVKDAAAHVRELLAVGYQRMAASPAAAG